MAVRAFDLTDVSAATVTVREAAPRTRRETRRLRQRHAVVGLVLLTVPFAAALVVIGVVH